MAHRDPDDFAKMERSIIKLNAEEFREFVRQLDNPSPPTKKLVELLRRKPVWEK